ncbi:hypothetical protein NE237_024793 [Protea cynaroides]|uniref:Uncharacterized protein n=1 Tax=Protea cynaroides TaxID=273540 RepID=A0A9Q0H0P7_9MAGN|nr:hypothetical protein NE237_024793 [Protea cynaroides]
MGIADSIQKATAETSNPLLFHTMTNIEAADSYCELTGGVSDAKSDIVDVDVDDILYDERVKKKLQVLAAMVGITSSASPGVVLAEIIRILKDLERNIDGNGMDNSIMFD